MFLETENTPSEICAAVENTKRKRAARIGTQPATTKPRAQIANETATDDAASSVRAPLVSNSTPHAAIHSTQPVPTSPHGGYQTSDYREKVIFNIIRLHRLRQGMIKAQTKLKLQAMATIRFAVHQDDDYDSDEARAAARKRVEGLYAKVVADPTHELFENVAPYLLALEPLDVQRALYEKAMVREAKRLPVYSFVKATNGFGDVSFATIVGECGDIGAYKSVSAVWKRLGLAVFDGKRQGAPGEGATKDDWIRHGYNKQRRSVSWNARNQIVGGMGLWRPAFGSDLADATYYQRVFAERARYESEKLGLPVTESNKGKESYKKHATNRAMRYAEKRLLRELYKAWRRAATQVAAD